MSLDLHTHKSYLLPLYILGVDINYRQEKVSRPTGYPSFQISICLSGSGTYIDENKKEHKMQKGDLFFFSPSVPHEYYPDTADWKCPYIVFTGHSVPTLKDYFEWPPSFVLHNIKTEDFNKIIMYYNKIFTTFFSDNSFKHEQCSSLLYSLIVNISEQRFTAEQSENKLIKQQLAPVLNYLKRHISENIGVEDLALAADISPGKITALFKHAYSTTPANFIKQSKVEEAKFILTTYPSLKIKEVSERCGFTSSAYFVTVFKKEVGMSPSDYRIANESPFIW